MQAGAKSKNERAVREALDARSAAVVLKTPLFATVQHDTTVWRPDPHGSYSVRSAYKLCMEEILDTDELKVEGDWGFLWKLEVPLPPKVKNLMWRACRESIPTRENLHHRGMDVINRCPWCDRDGESSCHIFLACPKSVAIWRQLQLWSVIKPKLTNTGCFRQAFFQILKQLMKEELRIFAMTIWSIWRSRNQMVWERNDERPAMIIYRGKTMLDEWSTTRRIDKQGGVQEANGPLVRWKRPPVGFFKCNIDAYFSQRHNRVGIGLCLRDEFGCFVGAKTHWIQPLLDVKLGEACGLQAAVEWVRDLGLKNFIFELDSKLVVDAFKSSVRDVTELGSIVKSCRELLSSFCKNSHVEFARRQTNMIAHTLAQAAIYNASSHLYSDVSTCIDSLIFNELQ